MKSTAIVIPIEEMHREDNFGLVTKETFGPFQMVTCYKQDQLDMVLMLARGCIRI